MSAAHSGPLRWVRNPRTDREAVWPEGYLTAASMRSARAEISGWRGYVPTPLVDFSALASETGVASLSIKNEGERFEVRSFKPLGGGYAVARVAARHGGSGSSGRPDASDVTVTCATDGNHGRAVAWAARRAGCRAVVYLAAHVSEGREAAIREFGASVVRTSGNHDEAVCAAAADAEQSGWFLITQMAHATEAQIPRDILDGYATVFAEIDEQLSAPPTHVFVPAGVGGLAAAAAGYARRHWGASRPSVIAVEPHAADCVFRSVAAGERVAVEGALNTVMGGLAAGVVAEAAWPFIRDGVDAAVTIADDVAVETLRRLARPAGTVAPLVVGESGIATIAAASAVLRRDDARDALGLDSASRIVCVATEGITDPVTYERVMRG